MLNDKLFAALQRISPVEVANEGVSAELKIYPDGGWEIDAAEEHGEQYRINCPFCKDTHKHLYVSYLSYARPVKDGNILMNGRLIAQCFRRGCLKDPNNRMEFERMLGIALSSFTGDAADLSAVIEPTVSEIPEERFKVSGEPTLEGIRTWVPGFDFISESSDPGILSYLESRRITAHELEWMRIGCGQIISPKSGKPLNGGKPYVIFPILQNGALAGVQARCPDCYMTERTGRYWFHPAMRKSLAVYNIDEARSIGLGVVCEGIFDVASVGKAGVCTFGCTPSRAQRNLLAGIGNCLVMLPDTDGGAQVDTVAKSRELCAQWNASMVFPLGAHTVILPAKDAGSLTRQEVWEAIMSQVPANVQQFMMEKVMYRL